MRRSRTYGWTIATCGLVLVCAAVHASVSSAYVAARAQQQLAAVHGPLVSQVQRAATHDRAVAASAAAAAPSDVEPPRTDAHALPVSIWFEVDSRSTDPLYVAGDVSEASLRKGPGHYPHSALPGAAGNSAFAGHRTTYGSPFNGIDRLGPGDTIHVADAHGSVWSYGFVEAQVVDPDEVWVIGHDPLGHGRPTITLTTCHPRFSAKRRLVVFGVLLDPASAVTEHELVGHVP